MQATANWLELCTRCEARHDFACSCGGGAEREEGAPPPAEVALPGVRESVFGQRHHPADPEENVIDWGENDRGVSYTFGEVIVKNFN